MCVFSRCNNEETCAYFVFSRWIQINVAKQTVRPSSGSCSLIYKDVNVVCFLLWVCQKFGNAKRLYNSNLFFLTSGISTIDLMGLVTFPPWWKMSFASLNMEPTACICACWVPVVLQKQFQNDIGNQVCNQNNIDLNLNLSLKIFERNVLSRQMTSFRHGTRRYSITWKPVWTQKPQHIRPLKIVVTCVLHKRENLKMTHSTCFQRFQVNAFMEPRQPNVQNGSTFLL